MSDERNVNTNEKEQKKTKHPESSCRNFYSLDKNAISKWKRLKWILMGKYFVFKNRTIFK